MVETTHASWIIVIAMNAEDWDGYVQIFILIIHPGKPVMQQ